MSYYTELVLNCEFDKDTPHDVIHSLNCLLGEVSSSNQRSLTEENLPYGMLNSSKYFSLGSESVLRYEPANETHYLSVHANIKDYYGEIDRFLSWMALYSRRNGFVGYQYLTVSEMPTLIYFQNGKAYSVQVTLANKIEIAKNS